mgnify:CR=1 FL=1
MQRAQQFAAQMKGGGTFELTEAMPTTAHAAKGRHAEQADRRSCYVFNVSGGGYVIVAGSERAEQILGYSDTGSIDWQHIPNNMRAWLQGYADEMEWLEQQATEPGPDQPQPASEAAKSAIVPLTSEMWNQGSPYNLQCPKIDDNYCVAGCAATAMAIVMDYHQWPQSDCTTISAYTPNSTIGELAALPPVTFDWANMLDTYGAADGEEQQQAVATLMRYCGQSIHMNYGTSSSSANSDWYRNAFVNYFSYDQDLKQAFRSAYTISEWDDLIYSELQQQRPVIYCGQSSGGGHAFVCDGYDGLGLYHINWGWGGSSNGYFRLSVMNPYNNTAIGSTNTKDGYARAQEAIIGIRPENGVTDNYASGSYGQGEVNLSATLTPTGSLIAGNVQEVQLAVTNNGDEYNGTVYLYASTDAEDMGSYVCRTGLYVQPDKTETVSMFFTPASAGTYTVVASLNGGGAGQSPLATTTATVVAATDGETDLTAVWTIDNTEEIENPAEGTASRYYVYGRRVKGTLTLSNNAATDCTHQTRLFFGSNATGLSGQAYSGQFVSTWDEVISAGGTTQHTFDMEVTDLSHFYMLRAQYYDGSEWKSIDQPFRFVPRMAVTTWDKSGNTTVDTGTGTYAVPATATSVDLTGVERTVDASEANPNCLYFIGSSQTIPDGLSGKNVVQGDVAAAITLTDGYDFCSPQEFTASTISYTRVFGTGATGVGDGWTTMTLPFAASAVSTGGQALTWFPSDSGTGDLWVKEFTQLNDGNTVYFDYAPATLSAGRPYIVAVPSDAWGTEYDLCGKPITFSATDARVMSGSQGYTSSSAYVFAGTTVATTASGIYALNEAGTSFALQASKQTVPAFRAYFRSTTSVGQQLRIASITPEQADIDETVGTSATTARVYTLGGRLVASVTMTDGRPDTSALAPGLYLLRSGQRTATKLIVK